MLIDNLPTFDDPVPDNGYRWWYIDAISDCGSYGIVVIAFVGSVFSPYYFRARRKASTNPEAHCALNVGIYGRRVGRWAMTERSERHVTRSATEFQVHRSRLTADAQQLSLSIDEVCVPLPRRIRGSIRVQSSASFGREYRLDDAGAHHWQPIAPAARIEVALERPCLHFEGRAYVDSNRGARALECDFAGWDWCRSHRAGGTRIDYHVVNRQGDERALALDFDATGNVRERGVSPGQAIAPTRWGIRRTVRHEQAAVRVVETLEDTPFYARTLLEMPGPDGPALAMHESLSLERFEQPWVRVLLPFRMPRIA